MSEGSGQLRLGLADPSYSSGEDYTQSDSKGHLLLLPRHVPYFSSTNFPFILPRPLLTVPY